MNNDWDTGEQLWQLLPAVYRKPPAATPADIRPPLQDYLASFGVLLDQVRGTLLQLRNDSSPEESQEWLLNYLARLLDVHPLAPHLKGKRAEIGHAIRWRQRKGTWGTALETASVVGNVGRGGPLAGETVGTDRALAVVVHEGWQRVAITPRIGLPIWPDDALGDAWRHDPKNQPDPADPNQLQGANDRLHAARHPNLPNATIDFRHASRALQSELVPISPGEEPTVPVSAVSRHTDFCGTHVTWEIAQPHGLPCAINRFADWRERGGSYQDFSRRTVDLRTPDWRVGHHHPKRVLLFTVKPHGFFPPDQETLVWDDRWNERDKPLEEDDFATPPEDLSVKEVSEADFANALDDPDNVERLVTGSIERKRWLVAWIDDEGKSQARPDFDRGDVTQLGEILKTRTIEQNIVDGSDRPFLELIVDELEYQGSSTYPDGTTCVRTTRRTQRLLGEDVVCSGHAPIPERTITVCARTDEPLKVETDLVLASEVGKSTTYHFTNFAFASRIGADSVQVVLNKSAVDELMVTHGSGGAPADKPLIDATDCLLSTVNHPDGWVRLEYCTVLGELSCKKLDASDCILVGAVASTEGCIRYTCAPQLDPDAGPLVYARTFVRVPPLFWNNDFGESGCGVLHPATVPAICFGAEDSGEMGGYHHRHHCRHRQAIVEKARKFLAVGLEPVVVVDPGLCDPPPKINVT